MKEKIIKWIKDFLDIPDYRDYTVINVDFKDVGVTIYEDNEWKVNNFK